MAAEIELNTAQSLIRIHFHDKSPIFFGPQPGTPAQHRFDAPNGEYRVLYAAQRLEGAFVETILRRPVGRVLRRAEVEKRAWSTITLRRPMRLAKLFDEGLQANGIDVGTIVGDYVVSRAIALSLYRRSLSGIAYRSRFDNGEICFALFDRVLMSDLLVTDPLRFDADPAKVDRLMNRYEAAFDTSAPIA